MSDFATQDGDATDTSLDPISAEIIRGKLLAVVDEMAVVLARASMSPVIYEVLDFACGVCDADGQLVAQTNGITVFTGTFSTEVNSIISKFGYDIHPGDIFITNNPFDGGTHLCDIGIILPIFGGSGRIGFAIAVAHWSEVGGKAPGSLPPDATEIYQEGICLPGLKLYSRGVRQEVVYDFIRANVRLPKLSLGDLNAELAGVHIAERRVKELCEHYGEETVLAAFDWILASSEKSSREAVRKIPDGVYEATDWIDGDGITDERFPVQVKVTVAGDAMTVDYTGSCAQLKGPVNCARGALISAVKTIFKALVDPDAPSNDGWFRPLRVEAPDGTVFTAVRPASVGWYYEGTGQASELVWKALAKALPESVSAGSANSLCVTVLAGKQDGSADPFVLVEPGMVGWGATASRDGASVVSAITNGDTFNYSIELLEAKFPLRVNRYALNVEGGVGPGRHRGGYGSVREYEILSPQVFLNASFGRSIERPWGLSGGAEGSCNYVEVEAGGEIVRGARLPVLSLTTGDVLRLVTGGGGGFGDPLDRPPAEVAADVRGGYITAAEAREHYAVVVEAQGAVSEDETARLRQFRRA